MRILCFDLRAKTQSQSIGKHVFKKHAAGHYPSSQV
jgi:hypothetical protein